MANVFFVVNFTFVIPSPHSIMEIAFHKFQEKSPICNGAFRLDKFAFTVVAQ